MSETLATIHADRRARHSDVEEIQIIREAGRVTVWQRTKRGTILLRDHQAIDKLVRVLTRAGFGEQQGLRVREEAP